MKHWKKTWAVLLAAVCVLSCLACAFCAFAGDAVDPAHEHEYVPVTVVAPKCTEPGLTRYICSCGAVDESRDEEIPPSGHRWGPWSTVREATTEQEGLKERTCLNDQSHKDFKSIPKVEPSEFSKFLQRIINRFKEWFGQLFAWFYHD